MKRILVVVALIVALSGCDYGNYSGSPQQGQWSACYGNGTICTSGQGTPGNCPATTSTSYATYDIDPGSCH